MHFALLNQSQVREFAFAALRERRPGLARKMTRVSEDFFETVETRLRMHVFVDVRRASEQSERKTLVPEKEPARDQNLPWLVNQTHLRKLIDAVMQESHLTQVSPSYMEHCDEYLRTVIVARIQSLPSVGKTIS